jgi:putative flippase GtrA
MRDHARRFSIFTGVGILNTMIDFACFTFLYKYIDLGIIISNVLAFLAAVTNSYVLNAWLTFSDRTVASKRLDTSVKFFTVALSCLGLSTLIVSVAALFLHPLLGKLFASAVSLVVGYVASTTLIFPDRERTASTALRHSATSANIRTPSCARHRSGSR